MPQTRGQFLLGQVLTGPYANRYRDELTKYVANLECLSMQGAPSNGLPVWLDYVPEGHDYACLDDMGDETTGSPDEEGTVEVWAYPTNETGMPGRCMAEIPTPHNWQAEKYIRQDGVWRPCPTIVADNPV